MHVLYLHQHFSTPKGSSGIRSYEFAKKLIAEGHQVTMVTGAYSGSGLELPPEKGTILRRGVIDGINVIQIHLPYSNHDSLIKRSLLFFRFAWHSIWLALRLDYDVLFATSTPLTAGIPGIVMRLFRKKPFVFEVRDLWPELPKAMGVVTNKAVLWGMGALEYLSYKQAHACIGLSPGICEGIERITKGSKPVELIPNGCDLEIFKPSTERGIELAGIKKEEIVAVFTGTHGLANGLDAVLDMAAVLKQRGRDDVKILFLGDGRCKPALMERAEAEGLDNCVFHQPVPKKELADILGRVDIGLMVLANISAFYRGTSPNKFFDYIAIGLPVVNNYPGWLAEMIAENACGRAVPPEDAEAFADAVCALADNPDQRRQYGQNCRKLAENDFNRDDLAKKFVSLLEATHSSK